MKCVVILYFLAVYHVNEKEYYNAAIDIPRVSHCTFISQTH